MIEQLNEVLPPKTGRAFVVRRGETLRITDLEGQQVVDVAIFNAANYRDRLSLSYSTTRYAMQYSARRAARPAPDTPISKDFVTEGDTLMSTIYTPLMTITKETPEPKGVHKVNQRMCNRRFYESFGLTGIDGCHEIISGVVAPYGIRPEDIPDTIDFFMNYHHDCASHSWVAEQPVSRAGDYVELLAETDCLVAISNCPEDHVSLINGGRCTPMRLQVFRPDEARTENMTTHVVKAGFDTVQSGIIDPGARPIRTVASGDTVILDTWTMWDNAGGPELDLAQALALRDRSRAEGRGPHCMTGPIRIETALPGDILKVEILRLEVAGHGLNLILPGGQSRGLLADLFPDAELRQFKLDCRSMTTRFGDNITIPLRPFLGIMGVLPPAGEAPRNSAIPGNFGGNIDCSDLVAGTVLYLPVFVEGAGFYAGDAHAAQGCGEVVQTALETAMTAAELRLSVLKGRSIKRPWAETPDHFITMGLDQDLREAARQAVRDMIDLLVAIKSMAPSDAYALCSLQADLLVTQLVNGVNGIHARMPKAIFQGEQRRNGVEGEAS